MKGYWIALYKKISSVDNLKNYAGKVTPVIKSYGGKPLVRGGKYQCLEGDDFLSPLCLPISPRGHSFIY